MSLPEKLCTTALDTLVAGTRLTQVLDQPLISVMGPDPVGALRVFAGDGEIAKAVYVGIAVPPIGLDSHMVFAFSRSGSAVPHFTLDSVSASGYYAFHLDLIPRAELGTHLAYMDHCYAGLTATFDDVRTWDGLTRAEISPRQHALMSPWMLVNRATEEAFARMESPVSAYLEHWLGLAAAGVPAEVVAGLADTDLAARDSAHRGTLFNPDVDHVWHQITRLLGEQAEQIRQQLLSNELPA